MERTSTTRPAGELHRAVRSSVPDWKSSVRSWECRIPCRTSNGSSSTNRRISFPLVTLMIVSPDSGNPYPASAYGNGRSSHKEFR